ncbi:hypothetical protein [Paenibacillus radicis (ex Xue et al. 2023)]|uniref:Uncharacterized protein n=1 Tax=Paenibacillus radicis (ex Xue et al. 2023) TaxID=2972489 RepID=A0ABT1YKY4_9BACL|nr:hypothetical protein [Paenibacillus radicis (ex Xue et al. 2023)]MCR8633826.1 hypothetical protein [Paenibacillus radicis (ex Xue et al. 2023)]
MKIKRIATVRSTAGFSQVFPIAVVILLFSSYKIQGDNKITKANTGVSPKLAEPSVPTVEPFHFQTRLKNRKKQLIHIIESMLCRT